MIVTPGHSLVLGGLNLLGTKVTTAGGYWIEATAEGTDWGNPETLTRVITSFLMDGAIESYESSNNREMKIRIRVNGVDSQGLANGEAALIAEMYQRNTLTWTPPDNSGDFAGKPCVFEVSTSWPDHDFDDVNELNLKRAYTLTIKALPFAHADTLTTLVSPAPASTTPTVTTIDACTSATGWSNAGSTSGASAAATSAGVIYSSVTVYGSGYQTAAITLTRTGLSVDMSSAHYVRIDWTTTGSAPVAQSNVVKLNGTTVTETARNGTVAWYYFSGTLTSVSIAYTRTVLAGGGASLYIADISRSDLPQDATGQRQTFRSLAVAGSVRTPASLALADPTAALGSVLVYTTPNVGTVAQPPLRARRTAGSTETTDTSTVSGKTSDLGTLHTFDIPAPQVPSGGYLLLARVKHASAGARTLTWAGRSRVGSTNDTGSSGTRTVTLAAATWTIVTVAGMVLPTRLMGSAGLVRIELSGPPAGLLLDEAWLFNTDIGKLTQVEAGTGSPAPGGSSNRLWLDPASLDSRVNSVWLGNAADRSDAFGAGETIGAMERHEFVPPSMNVFTVTTNSVATAVTLSYYSSWHTHVA